MSPTARHALHTMTFSDTLDDINVLFVCGSGGVGKTSVAAAIAVNEAMAGRKVCVLTIDPARRLADAMGIKLLDDRERRVQLPEGGEKGGRLFALMLDPQKAFDRLVAETAESDEERERVYKNRVYRQISGHAVGMQEYMAIERLYELDRTGKYDLIIVDTPPMQHARDLLDAPDRMLRFLEGRSLRWFLKPSMRMSTFGLKAIGGPTGLVVKAVQKVTGADMLQDVGEFFSAFDGMFDKICERIRIVERIFADSRSGFCIVTSPERESVAGAVEFAALLAERDMRCAGAIVNRIEPQLKDAAVSRAALEKIDGISKGVAGAVVACQRDHARVAARDHSTVERIRTDLGHIPVVEVPRFAHVISNIESLSELGPYLYR